jgi:hypothetical protein
MLPFLYTVAKNVCIVIYFFVQVTESFKKKKGDANKRFIVCCNLDE